MLKLAQEMGKVASERGVQVFGGRDSPYEQADKPRGRRSRLRRWWIAGGEEDRAAIDSVRGGDAKGTHVLEAVSDADRIVLTHEAFSRRGFCEGAVRAAEWCRRGRDAMTSAMCGSSCRRQFMAAICAWLGGALSLYV